MYVGLSFVLCLLYVCMYVCICMGVGLSFACMYVCMYVRMCLMYVCLIYFVVLVFHCLGSSSVCRASLFAHVLIHSRSGRAISGRSKGDGH